jgi:hypothetical protein
MALASVAAMSLDDLVNRRPMEVKFASYLSNCTTPALAVPLNEIGKDIDSWQKFLQTKQPPSKE